MGNDDISGLVGNEEPIVPTEQDESEVVILADKAYVHPCLPAKCPHCGNGYGSLMKKDKKQKLYCLECEKYLATMVWTDYGWRVEDVYEKQEECED